MYFLLVDSLAYLTAATYGLKEEAAAISETLITRLDNVTLPTLYP